jgi:hypothetical protein
MADAPTPLVFQPRSAKERRDAARQYERAMAPIFAEQLQAARSWLVKRKASFAVLDSPGDRWYRPEHWKPDGIWIGPGRLVAAMAAACAAAGAAPNAATDAAIGRFQQGSAAG